MGYCRLAVEDPQSRLRRVAEMQRHHAAGVNVRMLCSSDELSAAVIGELRSQCVLRAKGATVLDLGCGAGTDLLIAAQMVGPSGKAIGVDMTPSMVERARASAAEMGLQNVELHESLIESVPVSDASVNVVISNGVIDLVPNKDAVFDEIDRVLRPGGRLQIADVVIHTEVSEDARDRIDLWTG